MARSKKHTLPIVVLAVLFTGLFFLEYFKPEPVNWQPTFSRDDAIPYGSKALYKLLSQNRQEEITENRMSYYQYFRKAKTSENCLVIISGEFSPDATDLEAILEFIGNGNTAFISCADLGEPFADSLNIELAHDYFNFQQNNKAGYNFYNQHLHSDHDFKFSKNLYSSSFASFDTLGSTALAYNPQEKTDFLKIPYRNGTVFLHLNPFALLNYNILDNNNHEYAEKVFSYISDRKILWDEYYKPGRGEASTPIRYILSQPPLKAAYFTLITALLLYLLFSSKRQQRAIPVINPPVNSSLVFAETIGRLYFQNRNHHDIAMKKVHFMLEMIRTKLFMQTSKINEQFLISLSEKTSYPFEDVKKLFDTIAGIQQKSRINEIELKYLNKQIEKFYSHIL